MTLKRSFSKKLKTTIAKTKQMVSPTIGSKRSQSSIFTDDSDSIHSSYSYSYTSYSDQPNIDNLAVPSLNEPYQGLGIMNVAANIGNTSSNTNHTPTNSISSIQKSVSHIIQVTKSTASNSNTNEQSNDLDSAQPVLLYTGRKKSTSIRRNKSIQQIHPLEFIDTTSTIPVSAATTTINPTTLIPTPNSVPSSHHEYFHHDHQDDYDDNLENENSTQKSFRRSDEVLLLPTDPVDKSIPPCTTEQLTPILPLNLDPSNNANGYFNIELVSPNINLEALEKSPMVVSNLSSATSTTINSSLTENSYTTKRTSASLNDSPIRLSFSNIQKTYTAPSCNLHEIIQHDVNSIFTRLNQIDHLDKALDAKKNDQLADQMALNILQNITEENVDELSKLKEEISMKF